MTRCLDRCFRQRALWVATLVLWITSSEATAQSLTNYASHQQSGRSVIVASDSGQRVRITPYGDSIVRVQAIASGAFLPDDHNAMVERHDHGGSLAITDTAGALELASTSGRLRLTKSPLRVSFFRTGSATPFLADADGVVFGGGVAQRFAIDPAERFAGLGHGYLGRVAKLDLTGTEVQRNYGAAQG